MIQYNKYEYQKSYDKNKQILNNYLIKIRKNCKNYDDNYNCDYNCDCDCDCDDNIKQMINIFLEKEREKYNIFAITMGVDDCCQFRSEPLVANGQSIPNVKNTIKMNYRLGGQSIAIMTTILLILTDKNYLNLSDTVDNWIPSVPNSNKITLRMLGNSTSGLKDLALDNPDFLNKFKSDPFQFFSKEELLQIVINSVPLFEPGTDFHFTPHTNLLLLGLIMEMVTCKKMEELLKMYITDPLKISNTKYDDETAIIPCPVLHAFINDKTENQVLETTYWSPSFGTYSTGTTSIVADMMVIIEAIAKGKLITRQSYEELIAPTTVGLGPNTIDRYYALGFTIGGYIIRNKPLFWVVESFNGYNGMWGVIPSTNFKIHIECNTTDEILSAFAIQIFEDFLNYFNIPYKKTF